MGGGRLGRRPTAACPSLLRPSSKTRSLLLLGAAKHPGGSRISRPPSHLCSQGQRYDVSEHDWGGGGGKPSGKALESGLIRPRGLPFWLLLFSCLPLGSRWDGAGLQKSSRDQSATSQGEAKQEGRWHLST